MTPKSDSPVLARGVAVLAAAGLCLFPAASALAGGGNASGPKSVTSPFEYGKDVSSWYWNRQIDQEVTTPTPLPPPIPPVSQRVRLPSPQCPDSLPVGVNQGQHERMSALKFDLVERGVTLGSDIKKLTLTIEEGTGTGACGNRHEQPSFHPELAKIQACLLLDLLSSGENERFEDRPKHSETDCAEGKREAPAGTPPVWKFDLSKLAQPWGKDPFSNNGVMLLGVVPPGSTESWQVNLKIPARDATGATDPATKQRVLIDLEFVPGEEPTLETTEPAGEGLDSGPSASGGSFGTTGTAGTGNFGPSTDLTGSGGGSPVIPGTETATEEPTSAATTPVASTTPEPRLPAYVWLAIPLGLLALSAVRSVVLEPAGGPRPDGVIAAIRRRNAERRGGVMREATDPMARFVAATRRRAVATGKRLAAAGRAVGRPISKIAGSVRRS